MNKASQHGIVLVICKLANNGPVVLDIICNNQGYMHSSPQLFAPKEREKHKETDEDFTSPIQCQRLHSTVPRSGH